LKDLALATGAFTLALALMHVGGVLGIMKLGLGTALLTMLFRAPVMLVAFAPAFIIHELGHKFAAKYYGCWAEFRADPSGLRFGVILALLLGIVFMAPGAVMVAGNVSRKQNGHIAIAGPLVNLALLLFGIGAGGVLLSVFGGYGLAELVVFYWLAANSILGAFNMLPFGPLDGRKIKTWSEPVFWVTISIFAFAVYAFFTDMQMGWVETIAGLI
jgi:Zn-dependent protease